MELWADLTRSTAEATPRALAHAGSAAVTTVLLRPDQLAGWEPLERIDVACRASPADPARGAARAFDLAAGERAHAVSAGGRFREVVVGRARPRRRTERHVGIKVAERVSEF
jgi:hypothetical protein